MFQDVSTEQLSKLFFKQLPFQKTTRLVPKLLVYPIRRGFWMSVMRTQHESIMKAITHCQERWAPKTRACNPGHAFYFELRLEKKQASGNHSVKKKKNWLTGGGARQLAASFASGGCQYRESWLRLEVGSKKREADVRLKRLRSIYNSRGTEEFLLIQKLKTPKYTVRGRVCLLKFQALPVPFTQVISPSLSSTFLSWLCFFFQLRGQKDPCGVRRKYFKRGKIARIWGRCGKKQSASILTHLFM